MGFFYQAIKKAAGAPAEEPAASAVSVATPPAPAAAPPTTANAGRTSILAAARRKLHVPAKIEKLVAVLSPPVLDGHVSAMEECRLIRSRIRETMRARKFKTLMLTSSSAGEGKTLLAVNLAYALSQLENTRVLLLDADLRRPNVAHFLSAAVENGLCEFLEQPLSVSDVTYEVSKTLDVIPAGKAIENSAELLHGDRMQLLLAEVSARYDIVLLDAPPVFPIADAQVLAPLVDAAVLVVRAEANSYRLAVQAAEILQGKTIGTVLNCASSVRHADAYYGYGRYRVAAAGERN